MEEGRREEGWAPRLWSGVKVVTVSKSFVRFESSKRLVVQNEINLRCCRRLLWTACPRLHRCIAQSVTFATLHGRVLLVRSSWHSMSRPPWHSIALRRRFAGALVFDELFARPRADPRVFFFHTLWVLPQLRSLRELRVDLLSCTEWKRLACVNTTPHLRTFRTSAHESAVSVSVLIKKPSSHSPRHVARAVIVVPFLDVFCTFYSHSYFDRYCSIHMEMTTVTIHDPERRLADRLNRTLLQVVSPTISLK